MATGLPTSNTTATDHIRFRSASINERTSIYSIFVISIFSPFLENLRRRGKGAEEGPAHLSPCLDTICRKSVSNEPIISGILRAAFTDNVEP